jgi:lipopolysaccharide biosynthesis glycosyltransferase
LYSYLPIGIPYYQDILPYFNSGVMVMHKKRDAKILEDWRYCVEQACSVKEIAEAISCWDQGALKWALHKNRLLYLITPDKKFNFPAKIRHYAYPATPEAISHWIRNLKPQEPCTILHSMGSPKAWSNWGSMINLDLSI